MRSYVIRQGDYLTRLGARMGFDPQNVWDHPKNADLKARRKRWEVLAPGDVLAIPDDTRAPRPLAQGGQARFVAKVPRVRVTLRYQADDGPLAGEPYVIDGLPEAIAGETGPDGVVHVDVPVIVSEFTLRFPQRQQRQRVRVGHLDPSDESGGIVQRLAHLGYLGLRDADGASPGDGALRDAVQRFQRAAKLPATGALDAATVDALRDAHGDGA
ncbi:MAG: peptidoglycan-binding domain-containing protein [Polyangiales bacterium]